MVAVAPQLGEIDVQGQLRVTQTQPLHEGTQLADRRPRHGDVIEERLAPRQHVEIAVQVHELDEALRRTRRHAVEQDLEIRSRLALDRVENALSVPVGRDATGLENRRQETPVTEVEGQRRRREAGLGQHRQHEVDDFEVRREAGIAVELGAELQWRARCREGARTGVHRRSRVAETVRPVATEAVRIDTRDLWRHVGAQAEHAAAGLVRHLEGEQVEVLADADEQRIGVFEHRRDHQLVAPACRAVEESAPQRLDMCRCRGQELVDTVGQLPRAP